MDFFNKNIPGNMESLKRAKKIQKFSRKWCGEEALVVGAGPSLDKHWDFVKNFGGKIVCVDLSLAPLLAQGIKPDAIAVYDFQEVAMRYISVCSKAFGYIPGNTYGYLSANVDSRMLGFFTDPFFFAQKKWKKSTVELSDAKVHWVDQDFVVGASAFRFADALGAKKITMVGMDLCWEKGRIVGYCKNSWYDIEDPDRRRRITKLKKRTEFHAAAKNGMGRRIDTKDSFGNDCVTTPNYLRGAGAIQNYVRKNRFRKETVDLSGGILRLK